MEKVLIQSIKNLCDKHNQYIGDDAAVITIGGEQYLFSLDSLIENTHFDTNIFCPYDVGWKAAAVNISDIAAMGGKPLFVLVSLSLPSPLTLMPNFNSKLAEGATCINHIEVWITQFYKGLLDCLQNYGQTQVIGGDLTKAEKINVSISIFGKANPQGVFLRSAAKPGYKVCVTGKFGNSKNFLDKFMDKSLQQQWDFIRNDSKNLYVSGEQYMEKLKEKILSNNKLGLTADDVNYFLRPKPRLQEALNIWQTNSQGALIDASDGLAQSLIEIAEQSKVDIAFETNSIPKDSHTSYENALYGGEDYELLGCFEKIPQGFAQIGEVLAARDGNNPAVYEKTSKELLRQDKCYQHFPDS